MYGGQIGIDILYIYICVVMYRYVSYANKMLCLDYVVMVIIDVAVSSSGIQKSAITALTPPSSWLAQNWISGMIRKHLKSSRRSAFLQSPILRVCRCKRKLVLSSI